MSVSKLNGEQYYDPTAYEALRRVELAEKRPAFRPLVYICSPFSDNPEGNTVKARRYSRFAVDKGAIPFAPHLLLPQYMNDRTERELRYHDEQADLRPGLGAEAPAACPARRQ